MSEETREELLARFAQMRRQSLVPVQESAVMAKRAKFSPQEIRRRQEAERLKDTAVLESSKSERVASALVDWERRLGKGRFANAHIENSRVREIVENKVAIIVQDGKYHKSGLILSGSIGVGKTWVAYAYARRLVEEGALLPSALVEGSEMSLLAGIAAAGYERPEKMHKLLDPSKRFYLIDEVGRSTYKDVMLRHEMWLQLVNHCYEYHVPIVLTTNLSTLKNIETKAKTMISELEEWVGEAAYDRLVTICDGIVPDGDNKRPEASQLMESGSDLGMSDPAKIDPFRGTSVPSSSVSRDSVSQSASNSSPPPRRARTMRLPTEDLRPRR